MAPRVRRPRFRPEARRSAAEAGLTRVDVRQADAGITDSFVGAVPADVALLVGIFGDVSSPDLQRTIAAAPQLCAPGATLLWSRGRDGEDLNDEVRAWFGGAGFTELDYATRDIGSRPALGCVRYDGPARPLVPDRRLFTFLRRGHGAD